ERHRRGLQASIQIEIDASTDDRRDGSPDHDCAMSTHQSRRLVGPGSGGRLAQPGLLNEHVTHAGYVADLEDWHALGDERALMIDGPQRNAGNAERNQRRRMTVDDGVDITANLVDLAVNEQIG